VSPGSECKVPAGVLTVSLELLPPLTETLSAAVISTQVSHVTHVAHDAPRSPYGELYMSLCVCVCVLPIQQSLERQRTSEKERLFLVYAKQWWREFLEIRPSNRSKMVKIFAQVGLNPEGTSSCRRSLLDLFLF